MFAAADRWLLAYCHRHGWELTPAVVWAARAIAFGVGIGLGLLCREPIWRAILG